MATYNGERWVLQQLDSILAQLNSTDEVVIVDDCSTDNTILAISSIKDKRIKLFQNAENLGVISSFERAIGLSKGKIIFLSDQDDIWETNKVESVTKAFARKDNISLVMSDALIINESGQVRPYTYFKKRGTYRRGIVNNLMKSKSLGCAMAFRSELKECFLPFPKYLPGHDMWIGLVNEFVGTTCFIDVPLIRYRRHQNNDSPENRQSILKMIKWRLQLILGLIMFSKIIITFNRQGNFK